LEGAIPSTIIALAASPARPQRCIFLLLFKAPGEPFILCCVYSWTYISSKHCPKKEAAPGGGAAAEGEEAKSEEAKADVDKTERHQLLRLPRLKPNLLRLNPLSHQ